MLVRYSHSSCAHALSYKMYIIDGKLSFVLHTINIDCVIHLDVHLPFSRSQVALNNSVIVLHFSWVPVHSHRSASSSPSLNQRTGCSTSRGPTDCGWERLSSITSHWSCRNEMQRITWMMKVCCIILLWIYNIIISVLCIISFLHVMIHITQQHCKPKFVRFWSVYVSLTSIYCAAQYSVSLLCA